MKIPESKDFWSGVMLIAIGGAAVVIARDYPFGRASHMGAGFFPIVLGLSLVLFGLYFVARGLNSSERIEGTWSFRALVMLPLAFVLFGILIEHAGFIPAMLALIVASAAAGTEFRFGEVLVVSALLTALGAVVFVWALGLPYPLIVGL